MGVTLAQWRCSIGCHNLRSSGSRLKKSKGASEQMKGTVDKDPCLDRQSTQKYTYVTYSLLVSKELVASVLMVLLIAAILGPNCFDVVYALHPYLATFELLSRDIVVTIFTLLHLLLLSGDVETNPGPYTTCGKASCPGNGALGTSDIHATTQDPLTRALLGATYNMGSGITKWVESVEEAVQEFVAREYPNNELAKDKLTMIPDLSSSRQIFSPQAKMTGLMEEEIEKVQNSSGSDEKKKILSKMSDMYRGEKGEEMVFTALKDSLGQEVAAIISSHKTGVTLLEKKLAKEVEEQHSFAPETIDFKITLKEKLCQTLGVGLNMTEIDQDICQYFGPGDHLLNEIKTVMQNQELRTDGNRYEIIRRKKDMEHLKKALKENEDQQTPELKLDPLKNLKHYRMELELNKHRREHDMVIIYPKHKTVMQIEVKAVKQGKDLNSPVTSAIKQLEGGVEELNRIHGHVLDSSWKFKGVIALPGITIDEKERMCTRKKICNTCRKFILVGEMQNSIPFFINDEFTGSPQNTDFVTSKMKYKKLLARMAAFIHLSPALPAMETMKKITGESKEVLGGYSSNSDFLPDLLTCPVSDLESWKDSTHSGSTPCIMFLNRHQLKLWKEKRLIFLADYSVGKTTMLKSKAMSLAVNGEEVLFIFLGTVDDWGNAAPTDAVMEVQNKQHLANLNLKIVTANDLKNFYCTKTWKSKLWIPNIMTMLEFYLKTQPNMHSKHIFIDEAPILQSRFCLLMHKASAYPFKATNLLKTFLCIFIYVLIWVITGWKLAVLPPVILFPLLTVLLLPVLVLLLLICILLGYLPSSFSPERTAEQLRAYSAILDKNSTLWIALHSRFFKDRTVGMANVIKKSEMDVMKTGLEAGHFVLPSMKNNMRNSNGIIKKWENGGSNFGNASSQFNNAIEGAQPPPPIKNLPSIPVTKLQLSSYDTQLEKAVDYAYRKLLNVEEGAEDKCVVIMMEDSRDAAKVIEGLKLQNNDNLTVYFENTDTQQLQRFLEFPKGVLLTTESAFSGMEASTVIYISKSGLSVNYRGSMMRAISQIVLISGADYDGNYGIHDTTFIRCTSRRWLTAYYRCHNEKEGNLLICEDCQAGCHHNGEIQDNGKLIRKATGGQHHGCNFNLKETIKCNLSLGMYSCECDINGKCFLKRH